MKRTRRLLFAIIFCLFLLNKVNAQVDGKLNKVDYGLNMPFTKEFLEKHPETEVIVYYKEQKFTVKYKDINGKGFLDEDSFYLYMERKQIKVVNHSYNKNEVKRDE